MPPIELFCYAVIAIILAKKKREGAGSGQKVGY
jgi:hypothetical protein